MLSSLSCPFRMGTHTYAYDDLYRLTSVTYPGPTTTTYTFDAFGNRTSMTDGSGTTDYTYDDADQLTTVLYPGGSVSYSYDAIGRKTSMLDASGTTTWTYDEASRVSSVTSSQGTIQYGYNPAGQRASMALPGNRNVTYAYDAGGRLASLTDWLSNVTSFAYDDNGRRTAINHPNGVVTSYVYDAAAQLTSVDHSGPSGTLLAFAYSLDANGNRTSVTTNGANPESYTLDSLNRLASVTYPDGSTVSYTYDANGNRLTKTDNSLTTTYTYNDGDQLTSDGNATYTYDANGNLASRGADTFTWDYASRMTGATVGGTTAAYSYDGEDVRVGKTVAGTPVTYTWDRTGCGSCGTCATATCSGSCGAKLGVPLLVDDGASSFLHADGLIADISSQGVRLDQLTDALGSSRALADSVATLIGSAEYDAFGSVSATSGQSSIFGFTGEQHDAESGSIFLRARYYEPATGRFMSADTVRPNAPGTQGYNAYAYVANNPTAWIDPSGHTPWPTTARPAVPENMAPLIVTAFAVGAVATLGGVLAANFQYLADIFWLLAQPGRVLYDVWDDAVREACQAVVAVCTQELIANVIICREGSEGPAQLQECMNAARLLYVSCLGPCVQYG